MRSFLVRLSLLCSAMLMAVSANAQTAIRIDPAAGPSWLRPYRTRTIPPINLSNSPRLESLVRAGVLYLAAQDVVALAIENNLDVEVQRYGPLLAREVLRRAQAGGALRSVGLGVAAGPQSVSLQGVSFEQRGRGRGHRRQRSEFGRRNRHATRAGHSIARSHHCRV